MEKKLIIFGEENILSDEEMEWLKDILVILGKERSVKEIDREYQKIKKIRSWPQGVKMLAELYRGYSKKFLEKIAFKYHKETFRSEAREVLIELKKRGHLLGIFTVNPQFITNPLLKIFPLDFAEGSWFEFKKGKSTGDVKKMVDRYAKVNLLRKKIKTLGLRKDQVVVIGDLVSPIDFPMVKEAGFFFGFDSKKESLKEVVEAILKQRNLREILNYKNL
ncbi:MAG: hypothetical protein COX34_01795 [Candidatus Nealsonbacteria bacterium CG23_combo_of_CG06-09_8_20_14_all_36_12]|uniref:HAD family hydrolase n=1 Tax=Candidatus Nealsonbacteria bacterium CG23_combo_of_CG06-09_8_20_14_all_36_12 TaxID=1974718 RepID=A0A2G9Z066_9BACT|nr:MAG: hypothetical protein COX34_01795 [Candidatus Nealsonbacteria bacterium CG23_combo_of_CG06-09_8_20_14_all_36_12]